MKANICDTCDGLTAAGEADVTGKPQASVAETEAIAEAGARKSDFTCHPTTILNTHMHTERHRDRLRHVRFVVIGIIFTH